ncbi:MAG: membrane dipeptidase [Turicibacter sp.]|nr:membrane dipeptidase [Turicibacter sp.]
MIFDTHAAILNHIVEKRLKGEHGVVETYHIPELLEGNITGGIWTYDFDENQVAPHAFDQGIRYIIEELEMSPDVQVVTTKADWTDYRVNVILGLESLSKVRDIDHLIELYNKGFRYAKLACLNKAQLTDEDLCQDNLGLSRLGYELVKNMNALGMVIDVTHTGLQTFEDIVSVTKDPIIASHANCHSITPHPKNLTDEQIKEIAMVDGVIGVTAISHLVHSLKPTVSALADHIDYLRDLVGTRHIALGFDFINYLDTNQSESNLYDCLSATSANNVIDELISRGYSSREIDGITHVNAKRVINHILKD